MFYIENYLLLNKNQCLDVNLCFFLSTVERAKNAMSSGNALH